VKQIFVTVALLAASVALAHRLSPAYFGLTETEPGLYAAEWKVSISGGLVDALEPKVPAPCSVEGNVRRFVVDDARLIHAQLRCAEGLAGATFAVDGLSATDTDVLFRVSYLDGTSFTHRLVPAAPSIVIPDKPTSLDVVLTYSWLGIEHILLGIDHLLFVFALVLLVRGVGRLVATITAFTIAHTITLAAASLGFVRVLSAPVEAIIALSILFLAMELARHGRTERRDADDLATRFPWLVAFSFGLLHGFGFAGALAEVGLPATAIPLALLFFNVGVEIGQLLFIGAVLSLGALWRRFAWPLPSWTVHAAAYAIGSVAAYWVFERTISAL
jgi:hypothetical protein